MGVEGILGNSRDDAFVGVADGANQREKTRNSIYRLRRDLWNVESALKALEARTVANVDPAQLKPEFSKMFDGLVKLLGDYYGLTLAAFGDDVTMTVATDFNRRFDFLRKKAGGG